MKQNDVVALGLSALVIGGLAIYGPMLAKKAPAPAPAPGVDPQVDAARQIVTQVLTALQSQGGGTPEQKAQAATYLEQQAAIAQVTSPAAASVLLQAAAQLRGGQLPSPQPSPIPIPPAPAPGSDPQLEAARQTIAALLFGLQAQGGGTPEQRAAVATQLEAQASSLEATGQSPQAVALLRQTATQLRSGGIVTGTTAPAPAPTPAPAPPAPKRDADLGKPTTGATAADAAARQNALEARYYDLRNHCADYLQGVRPIDTATLGAADRTAAELAKAGDKTRASDLGYLSTASYTRAGIPRPVAVHA